MVLNVRSKGRAIEVACDGLGTTKSSFTGLYLPSGLSIMTSCDDQIHMPFCIFKVVIFEPLYLSHA